MQHSPTIIVLAAPTEAAAPAVGTAPAPPYDALDGTLRQAMASGLPLRLVAPHAQAQWARQRLPDHEVLCHPIRAGATGFGPGSGPAWLPQAIRLGVQASAQASGWLLLPANHPGIQASTLRALAACLAHFPVVYPQQRCQKTHPLCFSSALYSELIGLVHERDLARLASRYPAQALELDGPGLARPQALKSEA